VAGGIAFGIVAVVLVLAVDPFVDVLRRELLDGQSVADKRAKRVDETGVLLMGRGGTIVLAPSQKQLQDRYEGGLVVDGLTAGNEMSILLLCGAFVRSQVTLLLADLDVPGLSLLSEKWLRNGSVENPAGDWLVFA
jgi:hypothetical protein